MALRSGGGLRVLLTACICFCYWTAFIDSASCNAIQRNSVIGSILENFYYPKMPKKKLDKILVVPDVLQITLSPPFPRRETAIIIMNFVLS